MSNILIRKFSYTIISLAVIGFYTKKGKKQEYHKMQIGRKHFEVAVKWIPSLAIYGSAAGMAIVYFTDWKVVARYIPFYGGKFKNLD